jgi:hypothetical protein
MPEGKACFVFTDACDRTRKILTILFYQGKVARIDRETLQLEHAIENLNGANHIRPHSKGYMLFFAIQYKRAWTLLPEQGKKEK